MTATTGVDRTVHRRCDSESSSHLTYRYVALYVVVSLLVPT